MSSIKQALKFRILPKRAYLKCSAWNKYLRAGKKGETELWILPELVDLNRNAIDVGANTGLYTYFLSKHAKQVYSFEPHSLLADFLLKATADNVVVFNKGVSNKNSVLPFYIPLKSGQKQLNIASFSESICPGSGYLTEEVETVTLDTMGFKEVGFIKIDVEGHEYEVLEGAANTIKHQKPVILIEILDMSREGMNNRSAGLLLDLDYKIFVYKDRELQPVNSVLSSSLGRNFICLPA